MSGNLSIDPIIARRAVLAAGLAGAGAVTLAACGGGSASNADTASAAPGTKVTELAAVKVGNSMSAQLGNAPVVVFRPTGSSAVCFSAICTHQGCTVVPDGDKFACPCHGSMYDARTGKVLAGPAPSPLPQIPVTITNGAVVTAT
jgi:Rieske Fe-S protein